MLARCFVLLAALLVAGCTKTASPCEELQSAYMERAEKLFAEALAESEEIREELASEIAEERAAIKSNFPIACQALPKDFNQSCLLSRDRQGCELYGEAFDNALFAVEEGL